MIGFLKLWKITTIEFWNDKICCKKSTVVPFGILFLIFIFLAQKILRILFWICKAAIFHKPQKKVLNALLCNDINFRKCKSIWNVRIFFLIQIILHILQKEYSILKGPPVLRTPEKNVIGFDQNLRESSLKRDSMKWAKIAFECQFSVNMNSQIHHYLQTWVA